ncbi:bifunctional 2-polyprenyl-6-hydroxyphenol methylase/3-demethylubiquinol 3-O-methyltransferase UbiG [Massilia sp. HP4]|uniref:class I SAM-dependent methyltransferase n=1 Tax=Massilia sp. HP4 TaxID=2562316 RepID=UPI0010C0F838|nr:class I SAM-dependent methyltransferase [Massilia sp. HP4]
MAMNFFKEGHWSSPRKTIANRFADDDYGYVYHAGILFSEFLRASDISAGKARGMSLLDYGCGTGRVARFFSMIFGEVYGYDPVPECITESDAEGKRVEMFPRQPKLFTSNIQDITKKFDIIVSINVFEHLDAPRFGVALGNITNLLKNDAACYLWVHKIKNADFFAKHNLSLPESNVSIVKGTKKSGQLIFSESNILKK